jgi:D-glycero-alpha-D-manno-heptose-7-phosphate kinase
MIISRTPFRISFVGGGSDLSAQQKVQPGAVVSTTIDKYVYVVVNKRFDDTIRVSYTKTEIVDDFEQIQHELVREVMRLVGIYRGVEIVTVADIPAGTGLGSSSSLTVGLLHALHTFSGKCPSAEQLAQEACKIEIDRLGKPIGKQDQYAAAYGGLNYIRFNCDGAVFLDPILCSEELKQHLDQHLIMFYTALQGQSDDILLQQRQAISNSKGKRKVLKEMAVLANLMMGALENKDFMQFGTLLHQNWELKKRANAKVSSPQIDRWYEEARQAGALGGKILGAGGRGFLLFYCRNGAQASVRKAMHNCGLREVGFSLEAQGSKIV